MGNMTQLAQRKGPMSATAYLAEVNALSAKVEAAQQTGTVQTTLSTPSWLAEITPYAPLLVSGFLFIAAFGIMLAGKVRDAKHISTALLVAIFAASIPQVLIGIESGTRQSAHAGPQEQPRNIRIIAPSPKEATVTWETQKATLGAARYSVSPFSEKTAKTAVEQSRKAVTFHTVILSSLTSGKTYEIEILSGNVWYDDNGVPLLFMFR